MFTKKQWLPFVILILIIQAAAEAMVVYNVLKLGMLPAQYLVILFAALLLLMVITMLLLWLGIDKGPSKNKKIRRIFGIVFAVIVVVISVFGSSVIEKAIGAINKITDDNSSLEASVGIYVLKEDSAQALTDLRGSSFGIMEGFDDINTKIATDEIETTLGGSINTSLYASITEAAQSLYDGTDRAVLINVAYADLLTETEEFSDWEDKVRLLYEIEISTDKFKQYAEEYGGGEENPEIPDGTTVDIKDQTKPVASISEEPFIVYVSGSDTRAKVLKKSRSDVNILVVVNPKSKMILLLNTPRDYYVPNPAGNGTMDKLTHLGLYGVNNSIKALADLYDCEVNYYGQINFTGFEKLINSLGGIDVYSPKSFNSGNVKGYHFDKGWNYMDGEKALVFVRERYAFGDGDNMRGKNQMRVISAIIKKMTSGNSSVLLNYNSIIDSMSGMFVTNLESKDIEELVKMQLGDNAEWTIKSYGVSGYGTSAKTYSMPKMRCYVMKQDTKTVKKATDLIDRVERGDILTDDDVK